MASEQEKKKYWLPYAEVNSVQLEDEAVIWDWLQGKTEQLESIVFKDGSFIPTIFEVKGNRYILLPVPHLWLTVLSPLSAVYLKVRSWYFVLVSLEVFACEEDKSSSDS